MLLIDSIVITVDIIAHRIGTDELEECNEYIVVSFCITVI